MNASDVIRYGHFTILRTIDSLSTEELEIGGVCGWWSAKEIMAHLASYELVLIDVLNGFLEGGPTPYLDAFVNEQFNDEQVSQRKGKSTEEVLDEYKAANEHVMSLIKQIPPEDTRRPGTLPWYGAEYALDDFIVYTFYGHKREHGAQVAVFRDRISK